MKRNWALEWTERGIIAVDLEKKAGRWRVRQSFFEPWPDAEADAFRFDPQARQEALKTLIARHGLAGSRISVALPRFALYVASIETNEGLSTESKISSAFPLPAERIVWRRFDGTRATGRRSLICGISKAQLRALEGAFAYAGARLGGVAPAFLAQLTTLINEHTLPATGSLLMLDVRASTPYATLVQDGAPLASRALRAAVASPVPATDVASIGPGAGHPASLLAPEENGAREGSFVTDLERTLAHFRHIAGEQPLRQIAVLGEAVPPSIGRFFADRGWAVSRLPPNAALAAAVALAGPEAERFRITAPERRDRRVRAWWSANRNNALSAAALGLMAASWWLRQATDQAAVSLAAAQRQNRLARAQTPGRESALHDPAVDLFSLVIGKVPAGAYLLSYDYDAARRRAEITGRADSYATLAKFIGNLSTEKSLRTVASNKSNLEEIGLANVVNFTLEVTF